MERSFTPERLSVIGRDDIVVYWSDGDGAPLNVELAGIVSRYGEGLSGAGLHGRCYALVVTDSGLEGIKPQVDRLTRLAYEWEQNTFYVPRMGVERFGVADGDVAGLFAEVGHYYNVRLPEEYARAIDSE